MGFLDFVRSVGSGINQGLKATKIASTLAPIAGAVTGNPLLGTFAGRGLAALGYAKGGRVLKAKPMRRGGKVKKAKKPKAKKAKKTK